MSHFAISARHGRPSTATTFVCRFPFRLWFTNLPFRPRSAVASALKFRLIRVKLLSFRSNSPETSFAILKVEHVAASRWVAHSIHTFAESSLVRVYEIAGIFHDKLSAWEAFGGEDAASLVNDWSNIDSFLDLISDETLDVVELFRVNLSLRQSLLPHDAWDCGISRNFFLMSICAAGRSIRLRFAAAWTLFDPQANWNF